MKNEEAADISDESAAMVDLIIKLQRQIFAVDQHVVVGVTDPQGRIQYANERLCEMSGYDFEELLGQKFSMLKSGIHEPGEYANLWNTILTGHVWNGELCNRRKDGGLYWENVTIVPIHDEYGNLIQFISVSTDITRIKHAEMELQLANEFLEQRVKERTQELSKLLEELNAAQGQLLQSEKMASIGQLAAGVAHEINNPIGYVYSNLGTLEKYLQDFVSVIDAYETLDAGGAAEMFSEVRALKKEIDFDFLKEDVIALMGESREGITRVKKIVQDLKDFSHVEGGDDWQLADIRKGMKSTLNIVWNELKYKAVINQDMGDIPDVECLPSQLNQVFMNLLVNAGHAIEERGEISIRMGREGEGKIWVEVEDSGKGIPAENLERIFDPFFTTKPIGQGTGLGLSLSYGIIQKHHGSIEVRSEVGKGTVFRILLPIMQPKDRLE